MTSSAWLGWCAVGLVAAIGCSDASSGKQITKGAPITPETTPSALPDLGAAGERSISGEELDRLLDALEQEIGGQQVLP